MIWLLYNFPTIPNRFILSIPAKTKHKKTVILACNCAGNFLSLSVHSAHINLKLAKHLLDIMAELSGYLSRCDSVLIMGDVRNL